MTSERVYALLVEANPVPDPPAYLEAASAESPPLRLIDSGRDEMQTQEETIPQHGAPAPNRRPWIAAVAAAIVVVLAIGAVALLTRSNDEVPVVDESSPEAEALAAADDFFAALTAGDIAEVERITVPGGELSTSDRRMWGYNAAVIGFGYEPLLGECTTEVASSGARVDVRCPAVVADPVLIATGVTELVWPFDYYPETQRLAWKPLEGGDFSLANRAVADYLGAFRNDDYAAACDPAAYGFQRIVTDGGLAFTPECGELAAPLLEDIAAWVEAGRPEPAG